MLECKELNTFEKIMDHLRVWFKNIWRILQPLSVDFNFRTRIMVGYSQISSKDKKKIKYDLKLFIGRLTRSIAPTVKPPTAERPTGTSQLD